MSFARTLARTLARDTGAHRIVIKCVEVVVAGTVATAAAWTFVGANIVIAGCVLHYSDTLWEYQRTKALRDEVDDGTCTIQKK
jgi:hypothetical protein